MIKPFGDLIIRFRKDERGVFAVFFALIAVVLIAASGAVVDFTRVQQARTRAQIALDSAALALQAKVGVTGYDAAWFKAQSQALLTERIGDTSITAVVESATPNATSGKLTISGYISVPTYFVQLVGIKDIRSAMLSEVTRSSSDLEVSLSIDITGSMAPSGCNSQGKYCSNDKIGDLTNASNMLIDLLVADAQEPTYSKMAIVPWSSSVNVGGLANQVRGTPIPAVSISAVTWHEGTTKNISGISQADPGVITLTSASGTSGLNTDDWVYISGVQGMTQINGRIGQVTWVNINNRTLKLKINGNFLCTRDTSGCGNYKAWTSGGTVRKCLLANCLERVTTSAAHGIASGESVYITGVAGMTTSVNNSNPSVWTPNILTSTTYSLPGTNPSYGIRTSGGTSQCVKYGCTLFRFTANDGNAKLWQANNCVTPRATDTYTDAAPSTTHLGFNYSSGGTDCIANEIVPLTADKDDLHDAIGDAEEDEDYRDRTLIATGSTAGHLGLAWGWYMLAPNFSYLWPSAAPAPKAYGTAHLVKALIFMTDGVFNTPHCNGVIAKDTLSSANVGNSSRINCNSPQGASKAQAETLCTNIKAAANHIDLYVVGFDLASDTTTLNFLDDCAADGKFYRADTGEDLEAAFADIAQNLSDLRISR